MSRTIYCDFCPRRAVARAEWLSRTGLNLVATHATCADHRRSLFTWTGPIEVRPV